MAPSFMELVVLMFLPLLQGGGKVDLLSQLDPEAALVALGEKTDDQSVLSLVGGNTTAQAGGGAGYDKKEAEKDIQNLASGTESIRDKARAKLVGLGQAIRPRLEEVVTKDSRRADEAKKVLAQLDVSKTSAGRKQGVARMLAIRLAQARKLAKATPAIQEAAKSEDLFLARAAKSALAELDKPSNPPAPSAETAASSPLSAAVESLPVSTNVLLGFGTRSLDARAPSLRLDKLFRDTMASVGGGMPPDFIDRQLKEMTTQIANFVVTYGNVRISSIHVANVGSVGPKGGGVAVIATGDYEPKVLEAGLAGNTNFWTVSELQGRKVYTSVGGRILLLDDHTVLYLPSEASKHFPVAEYLKSFAESKKTLRSDARWAKFLETLSGPAIARGLALTTSVLLSEVYSELDTNGGNVPAEVTSGVKGMKELELDVSQIEGTKCRYRLEGSFSEAEQAKGLSEFLKTQIQTGINELEQAVAQFNIPAMKIPLQILKSIQVSADGKKGILRLELDAMALLSTFGTATIGETQTTEAVEGDSDDDK